MQVESRVPAIDIEGAQKVIRQQLILILHAHSCQQKQASDEEFECNLPYCKKSMEVIDHIRVCTESHDCPWEHCIAYQQIISHWKHCSHKKRCTICGPIFASQIHNALKST